MFNRQLAGCKHSLIFFVALDLQCCLWESNTEGRGSDHPLQKIHFPVMVIIMSFVTGVNKSPQLPQVDYVLCSLKLFTQTLSGL